MTHLPPPFPPDAANPQSEPILLTAEMQAKINKTIQRIGIEICAHFNEPFSYVEDLREYYEGEVQTLAQAIQDAERSRCLAACLSEMGGATFGEIKKVQAVERKIKEGWEAE